MLAIFAGIVAWAVTYTSFIWDKPSCPYNYFNNPYLDHSCDQCIDMRAIANNALEREMHNCGICHGRMNGRDAHRSLERARLAKIRPPRDP